MGERARKRVCGHPQRRRRRTVRKGSKQQLQKEKFEARRRNLLETELLSGFSESRLWMPNKWDGMSSFKFLEAEETVEVEWG